MNEQSDAVVDAPPAATDLRVQVSVRPEMTEAERQWGLEHPDKINAALATWYRHNRRCRRQARKRGESLMTGLRLCGCVR